VLHALGAALTEVSVVPVPASALRGGFNAEYFANKNLEGSAVLKRIDPELNFDWGMSNPGPGVPADNFSARWIGKIVPPTSGKYRLGANADDGARVYLDGKLIAEDWTDHAPTNITGEVTLEAGKTYEVKIEYYESRIGAVARLVWQPPVVQAESPYAEAVRIAKEADTVVLVLGISSQLEGEEMTVREPGVPRRRSHQHQLASAPTSTNGSSGSDRQADCCCAALWKRARSQLGQYAC
jgi:beta-glucosidase